MARTAGQLKLRSKDTWLVTVFLGTDTKGKKTYRSETVHGGRRDAEKKLRAMLREKDTGRIVVPSRASFREFVERWLSDAVKPRTRQVTYESYRQVLDSYVLPELGAVRLDKLTVLHLQALVAKLTERGLAPRTIRYAMAMVTGALRTAVRWRVLSWNPMTEVDLPRERRRCMTVPDKEGRERLLAALQADPWWPLWCLMITAGVRPSEALGLTWSCVDLEAGKVTIQRALSRSKGGSWTLAEPKTAQGRRLIPIPAETVDVLRQHRVRQAEARMRVATHYTDHSLVFAGPLGEPVDWHNLRSRSFGKAQRRAALTCTVCGGRLELGKDGRVAHAKAEGEGHTPEGTLELLKLRPYDLRHLHASLLLARGVPVKTISERLGHADAGFTLQTYVHVVPGSQDAAAVAIGEELFGSGDKEVNRQGHIQEPRRGPARLAK